MEKPIVHHNPSLLNDIRTIIEQGRREAYAAVSQVTIATYWNIGRRIVEEEQGGDNRAQYGTRLLKVLASLLLVEFGAGYSERCLEDYRRF